MPADLPRLTRSDAPRPCVGIVHLGLGAFFRAHGAIYIAEAMQASGGDWGILAASLQSPGTRDALKPQGYAYTALDAGPEGDTARVIEVIEDMIVAPEDPAVLVAAMAARGVKIVTLTVTEKGYCHNPATGDLNLSHPDIAHDLVNPLPKSAPGFLVRALAARKAAGLRPFTVLTCDNLPDNGSVVRRAVLDLASALDRSRCRGRPAASGARVRSWRGPDRAALPWRRGRAARPDRGPGRMPGGGTCLRVPSGASSVTGRAY